MFISNRKYLARRSISTRLLTPAPVRTATRSRASPASIRKAAAQRVPLPEISAVLPSELYNSMAPCSPLLPGSTRIQPSAPTPVCRWQMARAAAAAILKGLVRSPARVLTPAGPLELSEKDGEYYLEGPADIIAAGEYYLES